MKYKFREDELIEEFKAYIDSTYSQHYSKNGSQTMDSIVNAGHGTGFCMGNIRKYSDRYGEKGETPDEWRKDLVKVMHYCLFQLYIHDEKYEENEDLPDGWVVDLREYPDSRISLDDATPEEWDNAAKWLRDDPDYIPPAEMPTVYYKDANKNCSIVNIVPIEETDWVTRDLTL